MRETTRFRCETRLYDRYTQHSVAEYDEAMIQRVLMENRFITGESRTLIDVGTGTAELLVEMAARPEFKQFRFIGTDGFEEIVDRAFETVSRLGLETRVRIEQCDVHAMPYPGESADIVISRSTIHHWSDPVRAFREIYRILKSEGVAIIHEPRRDPDPTALAEFNRRREELGIEPARLEDKYTPDEVEVLLDEAGLSRQSIVSAPLSGPGSLGFEVRISKCDPVKVILAQLTAAAILRQNSLFVGSELTRHHSAHTSVNGPHHIDQYNTTVLK